MQKFTCMRITNGFRTEWQVEAGRAPGRPSVKVKETQEGLKESKVNSLESRGNTDICNNVKERTMYLINSMI